MERPGLRGLVCTSVQVFGRQVDGSAVVSLSIYEVVLEQRPHHAAASNVVRFGSTQLVSTSTRRKLLQRSTVRILVVDDFELFRRLVVELLGIRPELQVVGEASDGLEAIKKAVELRPDLILLDIGLPSLNGIKVARQMRSLVPESIIIFLTQESSAELVEAALSLGARGYVVKARAQADLFAAVEAALSGKTFVSNLSATANFNFPTEGQLHY